MLYRTVACDAIWTLTRLKAAGYEIDTMCEKCGVEEDTLHHRVWRCQHSDCKALRSKVARRHLIQEAVQAGPTSMWHNRGIPFAIADKAAGPDPQLSAEFYTFPEDVSQPSEGTKVEDEAQWALAGHVYYDGSCEQLREPVLSRASWAAVQVDEQGRLTATVIGTVPNTMPQTAQSGEYLGNYMATRQLTAPAELVGDCLGVVQAARDDTNKVIGRKRMHA